MENKIGKIKKRIKREKPSRNDYINNEEFTKNVIEWIDSLSKDDLCSNKKYKLPDKIILDLYEIGKHILSSYKFFNYPDDVKEDMLHSGLMKCVKYATKFDKNKFIEKNTKPNAFTYFTTIFVSQFSDYMRKYYKYKNIDKEIKLEADTFMKIYKTTEYINKLIIK